MAFCGRTSRSIVNHLKSAMGLSTAINRSSCWSSLTRHKKPPFTSPSTQNPRGPAQNFCDRETLFSESVKAEKESNSLNDVDHSQVHRECGLLLLRICLLCFCALIKLRTITFDCIMHFQFISTQMIEFLVLFLHVRASLGL